MSVAELSSPMRAWPAVRMVACADIGLRRGNNEDAVGVRPKAEPWPVAVLADGMGGYNAGEVASTMAVDLVTAALQHGPGADASGKTAECELVDALRMANTAILAAQSTPGCQGMGTTVVVALVLQQQLLLAHLGDSRAYAWREGRLQRITRDHSLVQQDIDAGLISEQQAKASRFSHLVTRALGVTPEIEPELNLWPLGQRDRIMLCSDGLTDMLDDDRLQDLFSEQAPLPLLLHRLIASANAAGGKDNISVVLMEADIESQPA